MADQQSPNDEPTAATSAIETQPGSGDGGVSRGASSLFKGPQGRVVILAIALALVAILVAVTISQCGRTPSTVEATQVQPASAEVFLEPATTVGDSPFAPTSVATEQPAPTTPGTDPLGPPPPAPPQDGASAPMAVRTANGDLPGLYGGTADLTTCDATLLVDYLGQNPPKGQAWSSVHRIKPDQISAYVTELTPVLLRTDTRVTDHGYIDVAQALPRQAVLQAGTAVLVDKYGSPRARCISGSPLLDPVAVTAAAPPRQAPPAGGPVVQVAPAPAPRVVFIGPRWPSFDPLLLVVIIRVLRIIDLFVLWDFRRGTVFGRQLGILIRDIIDLTNPRLRRLIPPNLLPPPPRRPPPVVPPVQAPRQAPPQRLPNEVVPIEQAPAPVPAPPPVQAPPPSAPPPIVDVFEPEPPMYDPGPDIYGPAPHSEPEPGYDDPGVYVPPITDSCSNPAYPCLPSGAVTDFRPGGSGALEPHG